MHQPSNDEDLQIGYVAKYDVGKNCGVIVDAEGKVFDFSGKDIIGVFPVLMEKPWVSFNIVGSRAIAIMYDPRASQRRTETRRGLIFLGAAKCPGCDWRIPALPDRKQSLLRQRNYWAYCPECGISLALKSLFKGYNNFIAVTIWVIIALGTRILFVESSYYSESFISLRGLLGLIFYMFMFLSLFFLYFQEQLVKVEVSNER